MNEMGIDFKNTWRDYVLAMIGARFPDVPSRKQERETVELTGLTQSMINRWKRGESRPKPAEAAKFAQAMERNVLEAFVFAGHLDFADAARGLDDESIATLKRAGLAPLDYPAIQTGHSA